MENNNRIKRRQIIRAGFIGGIFVLIALNSVLYYHSLQNGGAENQMGDFIGDVNHALLIILGAASTFLFTSAGEK